MSKFLGIVLSPPSVQYEGLQAVLDNIQATGAQAVCTGLGLALPAEGGQGYREPPLDIDGYERVLDRPLWGRRELMLQGYRTYEPDHALYAETPYRPIGPLAPKDLDRDLPHRILSEARQRGMRAHMQVSPTVVPALRDEDQVRYPDGTMPDSGRRVARQGCLNNPAVRAYMLALVRDTVRHYPEADGLFLDWVEYTVYALQDHLACLCPYCAAQAEARNYNWGQIAGDVRSLWDKLHRMSGRDLDRLRRIVQRPSELLGLLQHHPGWLDLLRFKADTVVQAYHDVRSAMDDEGARAMELGANGWCPPFNRSSGMDYQSLAGICHSLRPKLFTFHWSALPRWYASTLLKWNPNLPERLVLDTLVECLDLQDDLSPRSMAQYHIPAPAEDHPAKPETWRTKIDEVVADVGGRAPVYAYSHSYRSEAQWKRVVAVLRDSPADGMWVQRYDYLSDTKLDILRTMWQIA